MGGSLIYWGAIYPYYMSELFMVSGNVDSKIYFEALQGFSSTFAAENFVEQITWNFQQDNANSILPVTAARVLNLMVFPFCIR